jgi:predicted RNase H-like nuclease
VALAHSDPPRKVSKQTFNLFPKIREVDALMTPALQKRVFECHPEAAFWAMAGERALALPKKVKSRPHPPGLELRRGLLAAAGFPLSFLEAAHFPRAVAGADDVLDACACAVTASRIVAGVARRFPDVPPIDGRGLRQEIWA